MSAFQKTVQYVPAGSQFDGVTKGLFDKMILGGSGKEISSVVLVMGPELKDWTVEIIDEDGSQVEELDSAVADGTANVTLIGAISLCPGEKLRITTLGATSAMRAIVKTREGA